ncbi:MAG: sigma 54-interacting transcriptional regulator [Polyangiaceae bacterium]|nr:sigma 54-interacting transcriptional regulator [Polyangiaceae bacterium]
MSETVTSTTDDVPSENAQRQARPRPFLFVVLHCDNPTLRGARIGLSDIDEVTIGRGSTRQVVRVGDRRLELQLPSSSISKTHARLARGSNGWFLEDLGSKNGCVVRGTRVKSAEVHDGDFIEMGAIVLRFAAAMQALPEHAGDFDAANPVPNQVGFSSLVPSIASSLGALARIAVLPITTLLLGDTGTGKEVLAKGMHDLSGRPGPFIAVNCGGLTASLVESQLFGHVRGAFTGALREEPGFIRSADTGTLFLDEIGDLPLTAQATLLRVLQEREVVPVGDSRPMRVDVRVIAATNKRLDTLCFEGKFRSDLYARLAGYQHDLPPLQQRIEDLGLLVAAILERINIGDARHARLNMRVARRLLSHSWPLNIRELENALTVAVALADHGVVECAHLPQSITNTSAPVTPPPEPMQPGETREQVEALLRQYGGNVTAVARATNRSRMQVHRWLQRFGIDPEQFRE